MQRTAAGIRGLGERHDVACARLRRHPRRGRAACRVSVVPSAIAAAELPPWDRRRSDRGRRRGARLISRLGVATRVGIIESGSCTRRSSAISRRRRRRPGSGPRAEETVNALGIAYSQSSGTHQVTRDAALTKRVQPVSPRSRPGLGGDGPDGIRGAQPAFEGIDGLFRSYLRDRFDPERLRDGLGRAVRLPRPELQALSRAAASTIPRSTPRWRSCRRSARTVPDRAGDRVCQPAVLRGRRHPARDAQDARDGRPGAVQHPLHRRVRADERRGQADRVHRCGPPGCGGAGTAGTVDVSIDPEIERDWSRSISPTRLVIETAAALRGPLRHAAG